MNNEELITQHLGNVTESLKSDAMSMLGTKDAEHKARIKQLEEALKRVFDCCNPMYHETESEIRIKAIIRQALKGGDDE